MSKGSLEEYRAGTAPLPHKMLRWHLYGAGLENLGKNGAPEEVDVPEYGPDELLVRQDACGLCFSDTKVISLGANHPRMTGRDLAARPVTLGHEVSVTVVGVGSSLANRFHNGDRFVVQADVFYKGVSMAYGYAISGGLAEYSVIPKPVIEGDDGCYLLPVQPETGYVESALTEPWACVVSAYAQSHRNRMKASGVALLLYNRSEGDELLKQLFTDDALPGQIDVVTANPATAERAAAQIAHIAVKTNTYSAWPIDGTWPASEQGSRSVYDDIIVLGDVPPDVIEAAAARLADHGMLAFAADITLPRKLNLDIGRIHYNWHHYTGFEQQASGVLYNESRSAELHSDGITWIIGAGGPMGQMHVQRAVMHRKHPRRIVCTDVDAVRLKSVSDRFGADAARRGIELITLNPADLGETAFDAEIERLGERLGYDDILSMVPVAALIEHAAAYLAPGGWFNIFAGVARGTMARLDVNRIIKDGVRYIGSSGSSLQDMRSTLLRVEDHELSTNASLAAIGGMEAARTGLQAVKEGWFPGKTLIFPLIHRLPLTPLPELEKALPSVYALLQDGKFWTNEAEQELMRLYLA